MRLISFGSGSSGNAFLLDTGEARIMFDCGVGIRRMQREMARLDLAGRLDAIFISHEHIDHIRALESLLRRDDYPVFASRGTFSAIGSRPAWSAIRAEQRVEVGGVEVTPVGVSHDAAEPLGFFIDTPGERIALFTDLGEPAAGVSAAIEGSTVVILESNYCESMLRHSSYPAQLKRRIRSQHGHLSNDDCAATLVESVTPEVRTVWLAHLSENNNAPDIAELTVRESFAVRGVGLPVQALPRYDAVDLLAARHEERTWQTPLLR